MINDIKTKLAVTILRSNFDEPHVVYIFVEIRKFLEKSESKEHFPTLNFYADWVAHSQLQGNQAYAKLKEIEAIILREAQTKLFIDIPVVEKLKPFLSFSELRTELDVFLSNSKLPSSILEEGRYKVFLNSLVNILSDSPLKMRDPQSLIKQFVFKPPINPDDVEFEVHLNNGITYNGSTNFTYLKADFE